MSVKLVLIMDDNGNVNIGCDGAAPPPKGICYMMLEMAKDGIREYFIKAAEGKTIHVPSMGDIATLGKKDS